jgi:hypothetical protein
MSCIAARAVTAGPLFGFWVQLALAGRVHSLAAHSRAGGPLI